MDAITIERARRGDRDAQAALLRSVQDVWFRVCRSAIGDEESARDATQETALRFLRDLPRFAGASSLRTWSIGIAINVVREMRRSRARTDAMRLVQDDEQSSKVAEPHLELSDESDRIRASLDELSDRQREAIVLRFFEEMSVEETAAAMGCATGTVKATVHQALRILRTKLTQPK